MSREKSKDPPTAHENPIIESQNADEESSSENVSLRNDPDRKVQSLNRQPQDKLHPDCVDEEAVSLRLRTD